MTARLSDLHTNYVRSSGEKVDYTHTTNQQQHYYDSYKVLAINPDDGQVLEMKCSNDLEKWYHQKHYGKNYSAPEIYILSRYG